MASNLRQDQRGVAIVIELLIVIVVIGVLGFIGYRVYQARKTPSSPETAQPLSETATWQKGGIAIAGTYADAEVVALDDGRYRMYYSIEPEVPGNKLELYSAVSSNGKDWQPEAGVRKTFATFPDVVKLPDGRWRLYFQNAGVIKSAISPDGLNWQDEPGVRIDTANDLGLSFDNVAATTTFRQADGSYVMVYRGAINERYQAEQVPNPTTGLFLWATSKDGLTFDSKTLAIDSRNVTFKGMVDGPEFVEWSDGKLRLYFWSYKGVYYAEVSGGKFSQPQLTYSTATDDREFPPNPPGDPTLIKINDTWFMYYGTHSTGIEFATRKD